MTDATGKRSIALIGSTGSIGTQALEVILKHPGLFSVEVLTAQNNCELLIQQAIRFQPNAVVIGNESCYQQVATALSSFPIKVFAGQDAIAQVVEMDGIDLVLNALVGYSGLKPTLSAIGAGKHIALANKESLVIAGELVMKKATEAKVMILPVDSEHSAIFQCLAGEYRGSVEKIILTASGGPFRGRKREQLHRVRKEAALNHPNWKMGNKITIDSASMMNKGLEVIEARWLFDVTAEQIEVVIHPQSIIHSLVQFTDGSMKAQMGLPDMRMPILYALSYPARLHSDLPRFDFAECSHLTFEQPDHELFRNLGLAYRALEKGGNMPCVLNAANEVAVQAFLEDRISFLSMPDLIEKCLQSVSFIKEPAYEDLIQSHQATTEMAWDHVLTHGGY